MGISGLLTLLKSIQKPTHLRKFAGQTLGVDAYGWLHRGTVACAVPLALDKPTQKYVDYVMHRVRMLIHFGVTPYLVFDGDYLPSKAMTEQQRATRRADARRAGLELLKAGKTALAQAELQKAIDVTPEMAGRLIAELKKAGVAYVVAPYEADSQLAYLERKGIINGIVSEDSDMLVFGARVLLTKLDQYGECVMLRRDDFTSCREISLLDWSDAQFRHMAILSGCDYLDSIAGLGLKTANRLLRRHKTVERVVKALQFDGKFKAPQDYLEKFEQADRTFLYQWVFCPLEKQLVHLNPLPARIELASLPYIGCAVEPKLAAGVASGDLHPHLKTPLPVLAGAHYNARPGKENDRQTPSSNKDRSIESYFTSQRTPLAELDPNSFTPPSQRGLLTQSNQGLSRSASQSSHRGGTQSAQASSGTRQAVSTSFSADISQPPPPKRMRLCSEGLAEGHSTPGSASLRETSRFFSTTEATPSRDAGSSERSKKRRVTAFEIFSDDSTADALAELDESMFDPLGAVQDTSTDGGHVTVRNDSMGSLRPTTAAAATSVDVESQLTATSNSDATDSQALGQQSTQATSTTPATQTENTSQASIVTASVGKHPSFATDRKLHLKSFSYDVKGGTLTSDSSSLYGGDLASGRAGSPVGGHAGVGRVTTADVTSSVLVRGSEDLLIPNSEDELSTTSDDDTKGHEWAVVPVSPGVERPVAMSLDLSRFAFSA